MAYVTLTNISVLDNPSAFTNPFQFEVTFECIHPLEDDLEWKMTYVGSANDEEHDQVLEEVLVGPIPVGTNKFVFQANPPNLKLIPDEDKIGVTIVLVTCSYREKEFVRVGYYVNNDYADPALQENPPATVDTTKLQRNILADKPRVTRFPIEWGNSTASKDSLANMENAKPMEGGAASFMASGDDGGMMVDDETAGPSAAGAPSLLQLAADGLDGGDDDDDDGFFSEGMDADEEDEEDDEEDDDIMGEIDLEDEMDDDL